MTEDREVVAKLERSVKALSDLVREKLLNNEASVLSPDEVSLAIMLISSALMALILLREK